MLAVQPWPAFTARCSSLYCSLFSPGQPLLLAVQSLTGLRCSLSSSPARWPDSFAFDQSLFCWWPYFTYLYVQPFLLSGLLQFTFKYLFRVVLPLLLTLLPHLLGAQLFARCPASKLSLLVAVQPHLPQQLTF